MAARTRYARSEDVDIAYQVVGDGDRDVVLSFDWASHLEELLAQPQLGEFVAGLARFARVLVFDMRGVGMSGGVASATTALESWMDDVVAVMDAAGSTRASFVCQGHAAQMAMMTAVSHPERVSSLVLFNAWARFARDDDYPAGIPARVQEELLDRIERTWGDGSDVVYLAPSLGDRPGLKEWWGKVERYSAPPGVARARLQAILELDVRPFLPLIDVPTLVVHSRGNAWVRVDHGRYLAEHIAGARLLERDRADHWPLAEEDLLGAIEEFVTGSRSERREEDRLLATVLFVDVVESTRYASELGDRSWRAALEGFEATVAAALSSFDGRLENTAGDGVLATFDGPARAIRCAEHIRNEAARGGLDVRCGLHAGEVVRHGASVAGVAVHIGARVAALAGPGEVLVTRTVRDLVAGSGIGFEERGEHELKGVPDTWALYAAVG